MPIETDTSTSSSGGTTTVGAGVRDGGWPGGKKRELDVYLHIDPAKLVQVSDPTGPVSEELRIDKDRLSAYWKKVELPAGGSLSFQWRIEKRSGVEFEGSSDGLLVVVDRGSKGQLVVSRFCICGNNDRIFILDKSGPFNFLDHLNTALWSSSSSSSSSSKKTTKSGATRKSRKPTTRKKKKR